MGFKATGAVRKARAPGGKGAAGGRGAGGGQPPARRARAPQRPGAEPQARRARAELAGGKSAPAPAATDWRTAVRAAVEALRYDLVDAERAPRGLLRITIERRPGQVYAEPGEAVTVHDCEAVTRQLQYALEVDGVDYARLEVSSPGLDRPLRSEADYERFAGQAVSLTLREPFEGRRHYRGMLGRGAPGGWQLTFEDGAVAQVLSFALDEVREARLVPVIDFKRRAAGKGGQAAAPDAAAAPRGERNEEHEDGGGGRENEKGSTR